MLKARHNAASVCIARSFNRIVTKGLALRLYGRGIVLTGKGKKAAQEIPAANFTTP